MTVARAIAARDVRLPLDDEQQIAAIHERTRLEPDLVEESRFNFGTVGDSDYDLLWFDTAGGATVRQWNLGIPRGDATWPKPNGLGSEIALYVRRSVSHKRAPARYIAP